MLRVKILIHFGLPCSLKKYVWPSEQTQAQVLGAHKLNLTIYLCPFWRCSNQISLNKGDCVRPLDSFIQEDIKQVKILRLQATTLGDTN